MYLIGWILGLIVFYAALVGMFKLDSLEAIITVVLVRAIEFGIWLAVVVPLLSGS